MDLSPTNSRNGLEPKETVSDPISEVPIDDIEVILGADYNQEPQAFEGFKPSAYDDDQTDVDDEIISVYKYDPEGNEEVRRISRSQSIYRLETHRTTDTILLDSFEMSDQDCPKNFSLSRKLFHTLVLVSICSTCAMSSGMYTPALTEIEEKYNVPREVALLSTAMVLIGFSIGPIIWSAVNEAFGRSYSWSIGTFVFLMFQIPTGVNPNFQTLLIGRFFQGLFGVSSLVTFGGSMSDIWGYKSRTFSGAIGVVGIFAAPALGPVIASFLVKWANFGWISWLIMIMGGVLLTLNVFVKETFPPVLLKRKAIKLRAEGMNVRAPLEEVPPTIHNLATKYCVRPFVMLVEDKALAFLCIYSGISYGLLYTILVALPLSFSKYRHAAFIPTFLPSLSVLVGVWFTAIYLCLMNPSYVRNADKLGVMMLPDERIRPMKIGSILLPIGLFIFAWTAPFNNVHWIAPVIAASLVGFSTAIIFISAILYTIEAYKHAAASGFAVNAIIRSLIAVLFLLVISRMIQSMTLQGAFSFFAGVSIVIAPGPFILYSYGKKWRASSKWAS